VNTRDYERRLRAEEARLVERLERAGQAAREPGSEVRDAADASVDDVRKDEGFATAEVDWRTLEQVRDALQRIRDGTFGRCAVDGGPIEAERLRAIPWTTVCAKHARAGEAAQPQRTPTL